MSLLRGRDLRRKAAALAPVVDLLCLPSAVVAAGQLRLLREYGIERLEHCRAALNRIGIFPLRDHYYEPLFSTETLRGTLDTARNLPGIDLREAAQLELVASFQRFTSETSRFPRSGAKPGSFALDSGNFGPGDAEVLHSMVRSCRPQRVLEVGSGYSTLVVKGALELNERDGAPKASHVCIEPYEMPWLEAAGIRTVRERVENVGLDVFRTLERGDILFIDSSHMIRPGGDVLFLYLRVLPQLASGVLIHIHDIFTPFDYPERWLVDKVCFWNEQYLLEALLSENPHYRVLASLNFLYDKHRQELAAACPSLRELTDNPPKSFWIERV
jgi:hypothetical protein